MQSEIEAIERNTTWKLVELPTGQRAIGLKWVYKLKRDVQEKIVKYKARLVTKGYVQKQGIDYEGVFAPVIRILETVRIIIESECSEAIDLINEVEGDWALAYELKIIDMWKAKKEWKVEFTLADKYQNEEARAVTVLAFKEATLSVFDSEEPLHILWKILQAAKMARSSNEYQNWLAWRKFALIHIKRGSSRSNKPTLASSSAKNVTALAFSF
ncbi:hypothetical protein AgCh_011363 [Apium graveolens]